MSLLVIAIWTQRVCGDSIYKCLKYQTCLRGKILPALLTLTLPSQLNLINDDIGHGQFKDTINLDNKTNGSKCHMIPISVSRDID